MINALCIIVTIPIYNTTDMYIFLLNREHTENWFMPVEAYR